MLIFAISMQFIMHEVKGTIVLHNDYCNLGLCEIMWNKM